jgi:hypothetical protein
VKVWLRRPDGKLQEVEMEFAAGCWIVPEDWAEE